MTIEPLVRIDSCSTKIKKLSILKRIGTDYPILVRKSVAIKLSTVSKKLPNNIFLQVDSGHRNKDIQEKLWSIRKRQSVNTKGLKRLVFDPSKGTPPHTTGGAVDITLTDNSGREINLSAPFKKYYKEPKLKSNKISKRAQKLRLLLNRLMLSEGFAPNAREYWHFSYGDRSWATYYNKKIIYKETDVSKKLYYPFSLRIFYRFIRIIYRVLNRLFKLDISY